MEDKHITLIEAVTGLLVSLGIAWVAEWLRK
jgi:hypothetical protein